MYIKGPCRNNQLNLINSQFLDYIALLLKENPSIFLITTKKGETFQQTVNLIKVSQKLKSSRNSIFNASNLSIDNEKPFVFHKGKLARLKYKVNNINILYTYNLYIGCDHCSESFGMQ